MNSAISLQAQKSVTDPHCYKQNHIHALVNWVAQVRLFSF